jgi:hypothetical protein
VEVVMDFVTFYSSFASIYNNAVYDKDLLGFMVSVTWVAWLISLLSRGV